MRGTSLLAIALFVVHAYAACSSPTGDSSIFPALYSTNVIGKATYYGTYEGGGACSLDPTPYAGSSVYATIAIADNVWNNSKACGMCINVIASGTGSGGSPLPGSFLAFVNNECPSCSNNAIDLGLNGDGVWDVTWKAVPCPVASTKIQFKFQGSNPYYIKLQARNTRYPVSSIAFKQEGTWRQLVRTLDNFFTSTGSTLKYPVTTPINVQVTSVTGDVVEDWISSIANDKAYDGTTQFVDCSSGLSTSGASATSSKSTTTATTSRTTTTTTATSPTLKPTTTVSATTTSKSTTTTATTSKSTTGTGAATSTTTGKSSTTGSGTSTSLFVYQDTVLAPFQDWSWASTNPTDTTKTYAGVYSYSFLPVSWQAAYFAHRSNFSSSQYSAVEYFIYSSSTIGSSLQFAFIRGESPVFSTPVGTISPSTWTKITVPLPTASPQQPFEGIWWQDNTGGTSQPRVYLDSIRLIGV